MNTKPNAYDAYFTRTAVIHAELERLAHEMPADTIGAELLALEQRVEGACHVSFRPAQRSNGIARK